MTRFYLDTESTGLMGPLNLIQLGFSGSVIFIRPWQDDLTPLLDALNEPENIFVGYNTLHDIWKLYQHFQPLNPFRASFVDLLLLVKTQPPLAPFFRDKKSVCALRLVDARIAEFVAEKVQADLQKLVPKGVKIKHSIHSAKKGFKSISFLAVVSGKLKDAVVSLGLEQETTHIEETGWQLVPDEKEHLPGMEPARVEEYRTAFEVNEKTLDNPANPFWDYARKDIEYLFRLDEFFRQPAPSLNDHVGHCVAWSRYKGFSLDLPGLRGYQQSLTKQIEQVQAAFPGLDLASPKQRVEFLNKTYSLGLKSSGKKALDNARKKHQQNKDLSALEDVFIQKEQSQAIKERSEKIVACLDEIEKYNALVQRRNQANKLLEAQVAYPSFRVIGAQSGRMSGTGGFNYQGIDRSATGLRRFILASQGGDFDSLELNLAAYLYDDKQLQADLAAGDDLHLRSSLPIYDPPLSYEEGLKAKKDKTHPRHAEVKEKRQIGKTINFSTLYFCSIPRVKDILVNAGIPEVAAEEKAKAIHEAFFARYTGLKDYSEKLDAAFNTLSVESFETAAEDVASMKDSIESVFGFKRFFSFEKMVCQYLISAHGLDREVRQELARLGLTGEEIVRSDWKGKQSIDKALTSARFGAVLAIQQAVFRAAGNHLIQSPGAELTKKLMARVFLRFGVACMNVHDELLLPASEGSFEEIGREVKEFLKEERKLVPSLGMDWVKMFRWSDK